MKNQQTPDKCRARGIMFHHFHNAVHPKGQGAISADELETMIVFLGRDNILDAGDFHQRALAGNLADHHICLTLDDTLLCQLDIALPVLDQHNIKAFWFCYSSIMQGKLERLEIYRYFRTVCFDDIEQFYQQFFNILEQNDPKLYTQQIAGFDVTTFLSQYSFYTDNDRLFRYFRDNMLKTENYHTIMDQLMEDAGFDLDAAAKELWMNPHQLKSLHQDGHIIGLHSRDHPTRMGNLSAEAQLDQYQANQNHLKQLLGITPRTMAHPCGHYNQDTLKILKSLDVTLGFRAGSDPAHATSLLEIPREDHTVLLSRMTKTTSQIV